MNKEYGTHGTQIIITQQTLYNSRVSQGQKELERTIGVGQTVLNLMKRSFLPCYPNTDEIGIS